MQLFPQFSTKYQWQDHQRISFDVSLKKQIVSWTSIKSNPTLLGWFKSGVYPYHSNLHQKPKLTIKETQFLEFV